MNSTRTAERSIYTTIANEKAGNENLPSVIDNQIQKLSLQIDRAIKRILRLKEKQIVEKLDKSSKYYDLGDVDSSVFREKLLNSRFTDAFTKHDILQASLNDKTKAYRCKVTNTICCKGLYFLRDVIRSSEMELAESSGFGKGSLAWLSRLLALKGLKLGMTEEEIDAWIARGDAVASLIFNKKGNKLGS